MRRHVQRGGMDRLEDWRWELRCVGGGRSRMCRDRYCLFRRAIFCRVGGCSFREGSRGEVSLEVGLLSRRGLFVLMMD